MNKNHPKTGEALCTLNLKSLIFSHNTYKENKEKNKKYNNIYNEINGKVKKIKIKAKI